MGNVPSIAQTPEEFQLWTAAPSHETLFHAIQIAQGTFAVVSQFIFFTLVRRHRRLHTRNFYLLCLLSFSDLLLGITLVLVLGILWAIRSEPIPFGQGACQVYGIATVVGLLLSLKTYALIAYERYKALVTPLETLSSGQLRRYWLGAVVLSIVIAVAPLFGLGGYRVERSGLYCVNDFTQLANAVLILLVVFVFLGATVYLYTRIWVHLQAYTRNVNPTADEEERKRDLAWAAAAHRTAVRMAILPAFYIACWTPATLMIIFRLTKVARTPTVDILAAVITTIPTSGGQLLNLRLFPPLRVALAAELAWVRGAPSALDRGSSRISPDDEPPPLQTQP